ncbi:MAG TPA: nitrile hydratase subunit alpha [Acidimicrobiales bacterium]|nr:nitrile hydratase subunit alpha [Acidimicrobiales bacterium]
MTAEGHDSAPADIELRVAALEKVMIEAGLVASDTIDAIVDTYENQVGPHLGAAAVARAWVDEDFRRRLLDDATTALAELGIGGVQGEVVVAVENTERVHNAVVCTLCSCYPWPVLGLPPAWYKSPPYRARMVREPRAVLAEMGLQLDPDVEIRVWDSTAEIRYLVVPRRPAGSEGMEEEDLAALVTRDSMIGTGEPRLPS